MRALRLASVLCLLCVGCAHVSPWEREPLARVQRADDASAQARHYDAHYWSVRGGMAGGTGEPGGGCGCN